MRTTLEIDDRVLAAAKSRARIRGITVGQAISELALRGYEVEDENSAAIEVDEDDSIPMLPPVQGHVITDEMVERTLAEDG